MTTEEYEKIQAALDKHLEQYKRYIVDTNKQREVYERAVLACKSVLSKYNPERNIRLEESRK